MANQNIQSKTPISNKKRNFRKIQATHKGRIYNWDSDNIYQNPSLAMVHYPNVKRFIEKYPSEYRTWCSMRGRCQNSKAKGFENWGGRGIKVCERWDNFENFLADMGPRPQGRYSIDRINVDGNYEPSNCRWATPSQQQRNQRRSLFLTIDGETKHAQEWADQYNIAINVIFYRIGVGMTPKEALTKPSRQYTRRAA